MAQSIKKPKSVVMMEQLANLKAVVSKVYVTVNQVDKATERLGKMRLVPELDDLRQNIINTLNYAAEVLANDVGDAYIAIESKQQNIAEKVRNGIL